MKRLLKQILLQLLISSAIITITILVLYFGFAIIPTPLQSVIFGCVVGFISFFCLFIIKKAMKIKNFGNWRIKRFEKFELRFQYDLCDWALPFRITRYYWGWRIFFLCFALEIDFEMLPF